MRIVHVTPYFAPAFVYGGPPRSVLGLCQALARAGSDIQVLTTDANGDRELAPEIIARGEFEGVAVRYLPRAWPRVYFGARGVTAAVDRLAGLDVAHLHGCWNVFNWLAARACRRHGVPYVVSPRGMLNAWSFEHSGLKKWIAYWLVERPTLRGASFLHATSEDERREVEALGLATPIAVIPNGVDRVDARPDPRDVSTFRARYGFTAGDVVVLYLGRLHPKKRVDLLADAVVAARAGAPSVKLLVAGSGDRRHEDALRARFKAQIADGTIVFAGRLEGDDRRLALAAADVFGLTSESENFGLAVGEAMAASLPVIVSRHCPWPQIEQWDAGFWLPNDVVAIAGAIETLASDPALRRRLGENGRCGARTYLDWDGIARDVLEMYQRVVTARTDAHDA
jgi:glycosyltransferase involved in cell wall biosynthesis